MQNTSTSRSTDFRRLKTITSKTPMTLYGRGFCASDRTPTTTGLPARPQSNQNVWVLPPISCNVSAERKAAADGHSRFRPRSQGQSFSPKLLLGQNSTENLRASEAENFFRKEINSLSPLPTPGKRHVR